MQVLLVEDNPGDILLTEELFEELDFNANLKVLTDGEQAITYLSRYQGWDVSDKPELIILDINLPRKNGHQVKEYINTIPALNDVPVFMLTTSSDMLDRERCKTNNVDIYFTKPIEPTQFKNALKEFNISAFN